MGRRGGGRRNSYPSYTCRVQLWGFMPQPVFTPGLELHHSGFQVCVTAKVYICVTPPTLWARAAWYNQNIYHGSRFTILDFGFTFQPKFISRLHLRHSVVRLCGIAKVYVWVQPPPPPLRTEEVWYSQVYTWAPSLPLRTVGVVYTSDARTSITLKVFFDRVSWEAQLLSNTNRIFFLHM